MVKYVFIAIIILCVIGLFMARGYNIGLFKYVKFIYIVLSITAIISLFIVFSEAFLRQSFRIMLSGNDFSNYFQFVNMVVLTFTLIVLGIYTFYTYGLARDTNRLAQQSEQGNLRPVILRAGYINEFKDIKFTKTDKGIIEGKPLDFAVKKNIATDINGVIIIDGKKYDLLFSNEISKVGENQRKCLPKWGWMEAGPIINAHFDPDKYENVNQGNSIVLMYKDIEGNNYYTSEDKNFTQTSVAGIYKKY
ncbi:MAG: hypothetical protein KKH77_05610 [Candidatus Omnitrophica bacterium]|nr:hypothetical protein [Candidatus Omnitrophota bacterium]MBU1808366.1 hypothetical protein [Candidatus Omnitrophota bacterium]